MQKTIDTLTALIERVLKEFKDKTYKYAPFDKTFKGRIIEVKTPHKYKVKINGNEVTVSAHEEYVVGDWVWVTYPTNNVQNAFIVCKTQ